MDDSMLNTGNAQPRLKVSISTRLLAAFVYIIPVIGGALSSFLLMRMFRALSMTENAGIAAVMGGLNEATLPVVVSLYLAVFFGLVLLIVLAVRMMSETKTASPPIWFLAVGGIISLLPAALFGFAKYLTIEALSPGSSVSNSYNLGSLGASVSQLSMLSLISAPFIVILLLVAAFLPLSSGSKTKWLPLAGAAIIEILLISTAVAVPFLISEPKRKNELVKMPEVGYGYSDYDIEKETSMVLTLTADNKLYQRQIISSDDSVEKKENLLTKEELPEKLKTAMRDKTPDRRIVYFKGDVNASFENVLQIFDIIVKADLDKIGLVAVSKKNLDDPYQITSRSLEVKLPHSKYMNEQVRPNPLTLIVMLDKDGKLMLNREDAGTISDTKKLEDKLASIFKDREYNGVFRENTNEIEKTVFLKVSKTVKYGDFIKLVEALKIAGAEPIGIQLDDLNL